ncbi:CPBP family intramembrane metalloprotease [Clostridium polyendosporum]|uniref:CPBP family intramembrane metalloprotease n=1 Tax=Clostridium polyendosporum TaxID=69208 RepID=A0A919RWA1_9CLOT|nr:type II CAAX endopeptidase family protein [Clostridium polyendosporum]GIM27642.1 CPBP family intramembrane metalloprotease [Clostridium polyendosporum]
MNKQIAISYLIGTFLITYLMWGIIAIASQFGYLQSDPYVWSILFIIGNNAPAIMSYLVLKKEHRITGIKQFIKNAFAIKQKPFHYVLLLVFFAIYFGIPLLMQGVSKGAAIYMAFLNIPTVIFLGGLEELGWRYILQPTLEKQFPFEIATSFTACIWALWHLPLFFIVGARATHNTLNFSLFTIAAFGMSFALATIYYVSKNIWLCILLHTLVNSFSYSWIISDTIEVKICTTVVMIILSSVIVMYHKKKQNQIANNIQT